MITLMLEAVVSGKGRLLAGDRDGTEAFHYMFSQAYSDMVGSGQHVACPPCPSTSTLLSVLFLKDGHLLSHHDSVHTPHLLTACPLPGPRGVSVGSVFRQREDNASTGPGSGFSPFGQRLPGFK